METDSQYRVNFGQIARTLVYEDERGAIIFAFDVTPTKGQSKAQWILHLSGQPVAQNGKMVEFRMQSERERICLAFERTKQYAASRGYQVEPP